MSITTAKNVTRLARTRRVYTATKALRDLQDYESRLRKVIAEYEHTWWWMALMIAVILDFLDIPAVIPVVGFAITLLTMPLTLYIIIFNFRHGALRAKILRFLILLIDFFPIISAIWLGNIIIVLMMLIHARYSSNKAKEELVKVARKKRLLVAAMQS